MTVVKESEYKAIYGAAMAVEGHTQSVSPYLKPWRAEGSYIQRGVGQGLEKQTLGQLAEKSKGLVKG